MEAARSLHIQRGQPGEAAVEVRDGSVEIDRLVVRDPTLAELVERRLERDVPPAETIVNALEIGARVLDREATGAEVDLVERRFAELEHAFAEQARGITEQLEQRLEEFVGEDGGAMSKALDAHAGELGELIATNFGEDRATAVQYQIRELINKQLVESRQELLKQFSAEDGHNPLTDFKGAMIRESKVNRDLIQALAENTAKLRLEVQRLHDAREAASELADERERGTSKGRDFEQRVFDVLDRIASERGDVAQHVGDERSAAGGKRGDIVVEIDASTGPAAGKIVFDAKDEQLSKNKAWATLNEALDDRDASFAVLVVASDEKVPAGREQLHEYEGNKMFVALDREQLDERALKLAYAAARMRCLMTSEKGLELDAAGVRDAAQAALAALRDAQRIRTALTGATKGVDGARAALDEMVAKVEASLDRVESLIGT